ncbi:MAG TPA: hypothetical protein VF173_38595 [Thermoanaerobaculia bacterium]|nr:hypothetical protein [Thermoanaerobaculia bacterium]
MKRFSGTSKKGNLEEALDHAIKAARNGLSAERVEWTLLLVSGVNGGFAPQNDLTVEIEASVP